MSWIVDGHNLIPEIPGMSLSMPDDEEQLIKLLINFVRATRKQLIVYFDNAPPGVDKHRRFGLVSAHFVREGRSADTAIRGKLRQLGKSAKNWTVVSSDREVQLEARSVGATAISSKEFARAILSAVNGIGKSSDVTQEEYPDDTEVKHWLELFTEEIDEDR
jgi:predicted RNA-binding protein with PIN domain